MLGDLPTKYFLSYYSDEKGTSPASYGLEISLYGKFNPTTINGKQYQVIPLVHPRQAGRLGRYSEDWSNLHEEWIEKKAPAISANIKVGI